VGAVLLVAAYAKALDPLAFAEQIRTEGLDFLLSAEVVAFVAVGLEVALGLALVLGIRRLWILVPASLLVVFFTFLTGRTYWLDAHGLLEEGSSCGCFGNLVDRTAAEAFWQDLFLLVPPLLLAWIGRDPGRPVVPPVRTAVVGAATAAAVVFAIQAPDLPLDDLATRLKPGVEIEDLCTGAEDARVCMNLIVPELAEGRHVVILARLEEEATEDGTPTDGAAQNGAARDGATRDGAGQEGSDGIAEAVPALNEYALEGTGPRLWVVGEVTPERESQLYWQWGPVFDIRAAPLSLLRPLYRTLPRSFLVEDGEVVATFEGLPPLTELANGSETASRIPDSSDLDRSSNLSSNHRKQQLAATNRGLIS